MSTTSSLPTVASPDAADIGPHAGLAREIERLANAFFSQGPGTSPSPDLLPQLPVAAAGAQPVSAGAAELPTSSAAVFPSLGPVVPARFGPSALAVGAGGASPSVVAPPIPGPLKSPPPVETPFPRESDLRSPTGAVAENVFGTSAIPLLELLEQGTPSDEPYFLSHLAGRESVGGGGLPAGWGREIPESPAPGTSSNAGTGAHPIMGMPAAPAGALAPPAGGFSDLGFEPVLVSHSAAPSGAVDGNVVRRDFPILNERVHGKRLVWLDNGATTQKPQSVIDRVSYYYEHENSNVHRGAHTLAARSTDAYEAARGKVRDFLGAASSENIVFARGTTEAINLVAQTYGLKNLRAGDEILISWLEHHANIVPWQQLCAATGARLRVAPVDDHGEILVHEFQRLLSPRTKLVSFTHVSNALGTITPAAELTHLAKRVGAAVLVDGAQAVSHMPVNVADIGCDFYVFSGHKVFAPTGIGVLYGRPEVLEELPPWQGGGNMIADVTFERTVYQPPPYRFEAGTGSIADAVGLGAAIDYVSSLGMANIARYEHALLNYATEQLSRVGGLRIYGTAREKAGVLSFTLAGYSTEEVGKALDTYGVAVRSGHHCAQPILRRFGLESSVRASLAPYNTCEDIDVLASALHELRAQRPQ